MFLALVCGLAQFPCTAQAADFGGTRSPDPYASPRATPGGTLRMPALGGGPKSLNYYLDNNTFTASIFGLMFEPLLSSDPVTGDLAPGLALSWTVSDDGMTFTFRLDPAARWSDGKPVTAEDVAWTFREVTDPKSLSGAFKMMLEPFGEPVVIDERTVQFTANEMHWRNLHAVGSLLVLPKHAYEKQGLSGLSFDFPVISGPYRIGELKENISLTMERRDDWWARSLPGNRGLYNFRTLKYVFFAESTNAFEAFGKDEADLYPVYSARIWARAAAGQKYDSGYIQKRRIKNHKPIGFQGFAMNLRRPPYDDPRVRKALAHLLDRDKLNRSLMYRQYFLHRSYFEDLYDADHPCANPGYEYNPRKAMELLAEAGWLPNKLTGRLEKDGKAFVVRFLARDMSTESFLAVYREDLARAGIEFAVERKDFAAWFKDMDSFNFDMTWAAWSGGILKDPEGQWHSREAERESGNNITGFADARVDELIEKQKTIFSLEERNEICREIDRIITEACPYILLWNIDCTRLLYWNRFGMPDDEPLGRYGDEGSAVAYWWYDRNSADDLRDAMKNSLQLPVAK